MDDTRGWPEFLGHKWGHCPGASRASKKRSRFQFFPLFFSLQKRDLCKTNLIIGLGRVNRRGVSHGKGGGRGIQASFLWLKVFLDGREGVFLWEAECRGIHLLALDVGENKAKVGGVKWLPRDLPTCRLAKLEIGGETIDWSNPRKNVLKNKMKRRLLLQG